ncbi:MAG: hypothetical protein Q9171_006940, partial [Xanthocarpia ochracea]
GEGVVREVDTGVVEEEEGVNTAALVLLLLVENRDDAVGEEELADDIILVLLELDVELELDPTFPPPPSPRPRSTHKGPVQPVLDMAVLVVDWDVVTPADVEVVPAFPPPLSPRPRSTHKRPLQLLLAMLDMADMLADEVGVSAVGGGGGILVDDKIPGLLLMLLRDVAVEGVVAGVCVIGVMGEFVLDVVAPLPPNPTLRHSSPEQLAVEDCRDAGVLVVGRVAGVNVDVNVEMILPEIVVEPRDTLKQANPVHEFVPGDMDVVRIVAVGAEEVVPPPRFSERQRRPLQEDWAEDTIVANVVGTEVKGVLKLGNVLLPPNDEDKRYRKGWHSNPEQDDVDAGLPWALLLLVAGGPEGEMVAGDEVEDGWAALPRPRDRQTKSVHDEVDPGILEVVLPLDAWDIGTEIVGDVSEDGELIDVVGVAIPVFPPPLRERQSKPVQEIEDPTVPKEEGIVFPKPSEIQSRPVQGLVVLDISEVLEATGDCVGRALLGNPVCEMTAVADPRMDDPLIELQSRPVQDVLDPISTDILLLLLVICDRAEIVDAGEPPPPVPPKPSETQSSPEQDEVNTALLGTVLGICGAEVVVGGLVGMGSTDDEELVDEDATVRNVLDELPSPSETQSSPEQDGDGPELPGTVPGEAVVDNNDVVEEPSRLLNEALTHKGSVHPKERAVVGLSAVVAAKVDGAAVESPNVGVALDSRLNDTLTQSRSVHPNGSVDVEAAGPVIVEPDAMDVERPPNELVELGKMFKEALTQRRSGHPKGRVEVGLAGVATGDVVEDVVDNRPVAELLRERRSEDALTQRRFEQPKGKLLVVGVLAPVVSEDKAVDPGIGGVVAGSVDGKVREALPEVV